ncbi:MAG: L-lactate permease, partial [Desulfobacterales bacterium]|nr:L-lactate permease [Desulfobacterales bacterium]
MPFIMVLMLTRFFGREKSWKDGLAVLPFAIFAGLAFTLPYALTGVFLGPEFPSLMGGLVGPGHRHHGGTLRLPAAQEDLGLRRPQGMARRVAGHHRDEARPVAGAGPHQYLPTPGCPTCWWARCWCSAASRPRSARQLKSVVLVFPGILGEKGINADFHAAVPAWRHSGGGGAGHLLPAPHATRLAGQGG